MKWPWVKNRVTPKWHPGKWKQWRKPVIPWWFNFDPYPNEFLLIVPCWLAETFWFDMNCSRLCAFLSGPILAEASLLKENPRNSEANDEKHAAEIRGRNPFGQYNSDKQGKTDARTMQREQTPAFSLFLGIVHRVGKKLASNRRNPSRLAKELASCI